jgi:hypothetical protein
MKLSHIDGKIDYNFYGSHYYYTLGNGLSFPKNLKMEGSIKVGLNGNETLKHFGFMNQDGRFF